MSVADAKTFTTRSQICDIHAEMAFFSRAQSFVPGL